MRDLARGLIDGVDGLPKATPGRKLNESVTDGNCPWCDTESGPTFVVSTFTSEDSGTAAPVSGDFTKIRSSDEKSVCRSGTISRMMDRY